MKHKVFGEVYAVETVMPGGEVVAARKIDPTIECEHHLQAMDLASDDTAQMLEESRDDFTIIELPCRDASHWLTDIGAAFKEREEARLKWQEADAHAKGLKKDLEQKEARVMAMVGEATSPKPMPLFDRKPAA
jgi:hypothetical protein